MGRRGLWNRNFAGLMVTQFAGAANDNLLKAVLLIAFASTGTWSKTLGDAGTGVVTLFLTVPFVLLLGYAGQLADRLPKNRIIIATRIAEVPIAALASLGFILDEPWLVIAAFILLASESAFFSPAKYGCIPEVVDRDRVNAANGFINMMTNIAILLGTWLGGRLLQSGTHFVAIVLPGVAILGLVSSLFIRGLKPIKPGLEWSWNPFGPYLHAIRYMRPGLVWDATLAWGWFYAAAIVVLAIIPEYGRYLQLGEDESAYLSDLLGAVGLGVGIGCVSAGLLSGGRIRGWFCILGGFGTAFLFMLLGVLKPSDLSFWQLIGVLFMIGVFGGFYLIPIQSIQQLCSAPGDRARVLGTANAMSFLLMTISSAIYSAVIHFLPVLPTRASLGCGLLMLAVTLWMLLGHGRRIIRARAPESGV